MFERDFIGDFAIFVRGEWLTTFYNVAYGRVLDFVNLLSDSIGDVEIRLNED